jgi:hypothetical protein
MELPTIPPFRTDLMIEATTSERVALPSMWIFLHGSTTAPVGEKHEIQARLIRERQSARGTAPH